MNYFSPCRPEWFCTPVYIPNFIEIKQELLDVFWKHFNNTLPREGGIFLVDESNKKQMPLFQKFLYDKNLGDKWYSLIYIVLNKETDVPVHIDYTNGISRYLAFNIPLQNCNGSYHLWYDAELNGIVSMTTDYQNTYNIFFPESKNHKDTQNQIEQSNTSWCKNISDEIFRVECTAPMLVHVGRPHRPIVTHNNPRILLSVRFGPELTEEEILNLTSI